LPTIRNLLKGKFSDQFILSQNYIQKLKREFGNDNDASSLLNDLFTKQKENPLYLVIPRIDSDSCLSAIFCKKEYVCSKCKEVGHNASLYNNNKVLS
jgi:hypothetical protein